MEGQVLLQNLINKLGFIEGIIVSDREGIEIYSGFKEEENKLKENQISTMLAAAIQQTNDNLVKLNKTKMNQIMLYYDNQLVFISNWNNLILTIYTQLDANQALLYQIADDLKISLLALSDEVERINQLQVR